MKKITGINNILVDVFTDSTDDIIRQQGLQKGTMYLVTMEQWERLSQDVSKNFVAPGGSVCNTLATISTVGLGTHVIGVIGDDSYGETVMEHFEQPGIDSTDVEVLAGQPTGRSLIMVTPDGMRTMITCPGVNVHLSSKSIPLHSVIDSDYVILEGYMMENSTNREALYRAIEVSGSYSSQIAITLSDARVAGKYRRNFEEIAQRAHFLFGNVAEFEAFYDLNGLKEVIAESQKHQYISVITNSDQGSVVVQGDQVVPFPAVKASKVIDSTGAGDQYLAGFLIGQANGADIVASGQFASILGSAAIEQIGGVLYRDVKDIFRRTLKS